MTAMVDANNAASRLILEGKLDEAERALDEIEALLRARPAVDTSVPAAELDFVAAWDELIYSVHTGSRSVCAVASTCRACLTPSARGRWRRSCMRR